MPKWGFSEFVHHSETQKSFELRKIAAFLGAYLFARQVSCKSFWMGVNDGDCTLIDVASAFKSRRPLGHLVIWKQIWNLEHQMELQTDAMKL